MAESYNTTYTGWNERETQSCIAIKIFVIKEVCDLKFAIKQLRERTLLAWENVLVLMTRQDLEQV